MIKMFCDKCRQEIAKNDDYTKVDLTYNHKSSYNITEAHQLCTQCADAFREWIETNDK